MSDTWVDFPSSDEEPRYVICKSDSVEHLFWLVDDAVHIEPEYPGSWGVLSEASVFTDTQDVDLPAEAGDWFWMDYERAKELANE